jgi:ActR/RegA family two-component response regulator
MGNPLTGDAILIVESRIDQFVTKLQAALEDRGAETLAVREPARALHRVREFCFSASVVNYDHASDALHTLIDNLGDMPLVLYGHDSASAVWSRKVPHLAFMRAHVDSIVTALDQLLPAVRH